MPGKIAKLNLPNLDTLNLNDPDERQKHLAMRYGSTHYIAVDLETTGLDPLECAIVECAFVPLNSDLTRKAEVAPLHLTIQPHASASLQDQALKVNGHAWAKDPNSDAYKAALTPKAAHAALSKYLADAYGGAPSWVCLVGWNPAFDEQFLKRFYARVLKADISVIHAGQESWPFHFHKIDGIGIARFIDAHTGVNRGSYRLEHLAQEMFGDIADFAMHTAVGDIDMTLRVLDSIHQEYRKHLAKPATSTAAPVVAKKPKRKS